MLLSRLFAAMRFLHCAVMGGIGHNANTEAAVKDGARTHEENKKRMRESVMERDRSMRMIRWCGVVVLLSHFTFLFVGCNRIGASSPEKEGGRSSAPGVDEEPGSDSRFDRHRDSSVSTEEESGESGDDTENHCLDVEDTGSDIPTATDAESTPDVTVDDVDSDTEHEHSDTVDTTSDIGESNVVDEDMDSGTTADVVPGTDSDAGYDTSSFREYDSLNEMGTESAIGAVSDSEAQGESDFQMDTETESGQECGEDMILVPANESIGLSYSFCMDRYEASRNDATEASSGVDNAIALSRAGVIPWFENPMTAGALTMFENACLAAGKRICSREEWIYSCGGYEENAYTYGNVFDPELCNSVDTYCDDYCAENGIPLEECNINANCGYSCGAAGNGVDCFHIDPTGTHDACINSFGAFDVNGNVWEVVPSTEDTRGYEVRGGAFNCASAAARFRCSYNADWTSLYAGFRCCKDAFLPSVK